MGSYEFIWSSQDVPSEELKAFALRFPGAYYNSKMPSIAGACVWLDESFRVYLETAVNGPGRSCSTEAIVRFCEHMGVPPLSRIGIEGRNKNREDFVRALLETYPCITDESLWYQQHMDSWESKHLSLGRLYSDLTVPRHGLGLIRQINYALHQQGFQQNSRTTRSFVLPLRDAGFTPHSDAVAFLTHFADQKFLFKHGEELIRCNFHVARVQELLQIQRDIVTQLEAETADSVVPVGVIESSDFRGVMDRPDFICIGKSGWFYRTGNPGPEGAFFADPIGANVHEAMVYLYSGGYSKPE